ncbi:MAG: mediator complex subunit [Vezdaea aestivalis]|nr:MAG: mediator complex subunit [Vezdaea aestivalis]
MVSNSERWGLFCQRCIQKRLNVTLFARLAETLQTQSPIPGEQIATLFLRPTRDTAVAPDPRTASYIEKLLEDSIVDVPDVLVALRKFSRFGQPKASTGGPTSNQDLSNPPELEIVILFRISRSVSEGLSPASQSEGIATLHAASNWILDLVAAGASNEAAEALQSAPPSARQELSDITSTTGMLAVTLCESGSVGGLMNRGATKEVATEFRKALLSYVRLTEQSFPQLSSRLEEFRQQYSPRQDLLTHTAENVIEQVIASNALNTNQAPSLETVDIIERPIINSRAGLNVYLNSLLAGRPLIDDASILSFLQNRYKENIAMLVIDLITASFDVLANAMFCNEPSNMVIIPRSFLINKVPLYLATLAPAMFPPVNPEYCIAEALKLIDPRAFPSFSSMFDIDNDNSSFSDDRQDFLFACCLHGLLPEPSIEVLLGEQPMQTLPPGGRYVKEELVSIFSKEPDKIDSYIGELKEMSGNAGAIASAIGEAIITMGLDRDTMSLKPICLALVRDPLYIDVLMLFNTTGAILRPLCILLDGWRYDDDQGEHQPIWEEFGSVLLLVLAFIYRYDLTVEDLKLSSPDSFLLRLLENSTNFEQIAELPEEQSKNLGGWLLGMYKDGQISDELVSSCTPQQFYLLIPMLFNQTILACNTGKLNNERLKGGLEYLLVPFLLPSLVKAFTWFSTYLWQQHTDPDLKNTLKILMLLTKPASISGEAASIHKIILAMTAKPLEIQLRALKASHLGKDQKDLEPLIQTLHSFHSFKRTTNPSKFERNLWTQVPGGIRSTLKHNVQALVFWSANPSNGISSAPYTHRQIVYARDMIGCQYVVWSLIDELQGQYDRTSGLGTTFDIALDVIATMIYASSASTGHHGNFTLSEAVRLEAEDATKLLSSGSIRAEVTIRLHKRIEMQLVSNSLLTVPDVTAIVAADTAGGLKLDAPVDMTVAPGEIDNIMAAAMNEEDVFAAALDDIGLGGGLMGMD